MKKSIFSWDGESWHEVLVAEQWERHVINCYLKKGQAAYNGFFRSVFLENKKVS